MNCLVTGALGFIGSHLVDLLIKEGHKVVGIDNYLTGSVNNLNEKASYEMLDITNFKEMQTVFSKNKFDYVFHLAADARIPSCTKDPLKTSDINVMGTLNLLKLSVENTIKGFVFSSSSSVYGNVTNKEPIPENAKLEPKSIYAAQKAFCDFLVRMYHEYHGLNTLSLRYFNVYGTKRQNESGEPTLLAALCKAKKNNEFLKIFGDGSIKRDYVHVYDVAIANSLVIGKPDSWKGWGQALNVGTETSVSVNEVVRLFGYSKIEYVDFRKEDVPYTCASTWRAKNVLGFKATISLEEGIKILKESHGFTD